MFDMQPWNNILQKNNYQLTYFISILKEERKIFKAMILRNTNNTAFFNKAPAPPIGEYHAMLVKTTMLALMNEYNPRDKMRPEC
nr:hypothetical protein [Aeromonas hydrophila]